jgi:hypothetical protein
MLATVIPGVKRKEEVTRWDLTAMRIKRFRPLKSVRTQWAGTAGRSAGATLTLTTTDQTNGRRCNQKENQIMSEFEDAKKFAQQFRSFVKLADELESLDRSTN